MDRKWFLKALIIGFIIAVAAVFASSEVIAQDFLSQIIPQNGYPVALDSTGAVIDPNDTANIAMVLVDNFEYWYNPWSNREIIPPYPIWGADLFHTQMKNVLDFEQGSRVFDVYRPTSFFMNTLYYVAQIYWETVLSNNKPTPGTCSVMSLEVRTPKANEILDTFSVTVSTKVTASDGTTGVDFSIKFRPIEGPMGNIGLMYALEDDQCIDEDNDYATVALGRFQAGVWHQVMEDLAEIIAQFDAGPDGDVGTSDDATLESINRITIRGNQYRLDNIMFSIPSRSIAANDAVHLIHIGPVYCQIYGQQGDTSQGRWIYAEDLDLGLTSECTADDGYLFPHIADDADGDGIPTALHINPDGTIDNQGDISESTLAIYHLDPNGKLIFESPQTPADADLTWVLLAGVTFGSVITPPYIIEEAEINLDGDDTISGDEMNTWPPYLIQRNGVFIENKVETNPDVVQATGTPYVMNLTNPMYALARALLNSGYEVFPNAMKIVPHLGQVIEDAIFTCRVSDGIDTDKETFPLSVVNYPVTNNPPIFDDVDDQTFEVGKTNYYQILAYDLDLEDMLGGLSYTATLHGESTYYQFGPWWYDGPSPNNHITGTGLITYAPVSEDTIDCIVTVTDPRGMYAVCQFTIFCKIIDEYPGNWFNHPPVILGELDSPQSIRAGEMFIASEMDFFDPDGDKMYWSCNVGSVGNNGVYTFQSIYPGDYQVQIIAYDIRGGATSTEFVIHVKPWWSL